MAITYLFYDIETSGLDKVFDQVLQFAAIRTDEALREIERHNLTIALRPDVIPSPYATITHRIAPESNPEQLTELEAIQRIHGLLNTPGTRSLGYNTLGFDDEFLRFGFYRYLLPPYTHQFAEDCFRLDLYPCLIFYYLFAPEVLPHWPTRADKPSLKLEDLNQANQWVEGTAHDALVDVEATLALARCLQADEAKWRYVLGYFQKQEDLRRTQALPVAIEHEAQVFRHGLYVLGKLGHQAAFQAPVLSLGSHHHYRNQQLWLRLDSETLAQSTVENPEQFSWVFHKKLGEPGFLLPPSPRFLNHLSAERQAQCAENLQFLTEHPEVLQAIQHHYAEATYPVVPETDIDAALYQRGFPTPAEQQRWLAFLTAPDAQKSALYQQFEDVDAMDQAIRILGRFMPAQLSAAAMLQYQTYLQQRWQPLAQQALVDFRGQKAYSIDQAFADLAALQATELEAPQRVLLEKLHVYLQSQERKINAHV